MYEVRLLNYLIAVADAGTVAGASELVHVSQPSLSRQVHAFERRLGFQVFDRSERRLKLTAAGTEFLREARKLVQDEQELREVSRRIRQGAPTTLKVAAPIMLINQIIAPFCAENLRSLDLRVSFSSAHAEGVLKELQKGADIGVVSLPPVAGLSSIEVGRTVFTAQIPSDHKFARLPSVELGVVAEEPLLLMSSPNRSRIILEDLMARSGISFSSVTDCDLVVSAQSLAATGNGVAVLADLPELGLSAVPITHQGTVVEIPIFAVWNPGHYAAAEIADFAEKLRDFYRKKLEQSVHEYRT